MVAGWFGISLESRCPWCSYPYMWCACFSFPTLIPHQGQGLMTSEGLTPREVDIIRLVAEGKTNKIIAFELHLSEGTVKVYLSRVYAKLDIKTGNNKVGLALWAKEWVPK